MEMNLIGKTELWIQHVTLDNANLSDVAASVAKSLGLDTSDVLVVDAGPEHLTLDVLRQTLDVRQVAGRESELLAALDRVAGVSVGENTTLHSEGILQMLSLDPSMTEEVVARSESIAREITQAYLKRMKVFPTGHEVLRGVIEDTNSPYLKAEFERAGYRVSIAPPLPDDSLAIANAIEAALHDAYGLIVTTGGVGAEGKDQTIEATQRLDPNAATPWVIKYPASGRHLKAGVRIGVGSSGQALIVNLPGPNDEVRACADVLLSALGRGERDKQRVAALLADVLQQRHLHRPQ
jgi:molybdenum cofactor synthesis domain-containing protein